jgi:hypothetical protein
LPDEPEYNEINSAIGLLIKAARCKDAAGWFKFCDTLCNFLVRLRPPAPLSGEAASHQR